VKLDYFAAYRGKPVRRVVEPRMIFPHTKNWYLAAWSVADEKEKLYRLDRIVDAEIGDRCFGEFKGDGSRKYDRTVLFFEQELLPEVEIRFEPPLARLALEQWGTLARENKDGSITVKTRMASQEYAVNWAMGYGGQVSFLAPKDWQKALQQRATKLLARHR
jgi:predicted DNA-binding transcriptional regulator YafY